MPKQVRLSIIGEIIAIVVLSAAAGLLWNRTLLLGAWRGELTPPAQAAQQAEPGDLLPMPIGLAQVKELHDSKQAVIIDARNAATFAEGHISGALSLPLDQARKDGAATLKANVPPNATIIAYCNGFSCHDSMDLGKLLMRAGYGSVYVYEGGFPEWRDAGYPTAKGRTS